MKITIVAEIASNWGGSIRKAKKLIYEAKNAGADAVKFQMWRAKDLYSTKHPHWNDIKKSELTFPKARKLKQYADSIGIEFFCSVFYPDGVRFMNVLKIKRFKVASRTCLLKDPYSLETLKKIGDSGKPVIISMGMGGNKKQIENIFAKNKILFCYCVSEYPTVFNKINWNNALKYDGFSDHTVGITAAILFVTLKKLQGAKSILIEKHVKLEDSIGPDVATSIDIEQLRDLVQHIKTIGKIKIKT